jgi:F-type H+-transporting ATPase subunit delta
MSAYRLATRYAKSLLDLAAEKNVLEDVFSDVQYFHQVVKQVSEFRAVLHNPEINSDKKRAVFNQLFAKAHPVTKSFFDIVIRKHREEYLDEFAQAFIEQYYVNKSISTVKLTTAVEANNATLIKVRQVLKQKAGIDNIVLEEHVDPSLIGGFVLEYGGKRIDYSIARRLDILDDSFLQNDYVRKF